MIAEIEQRGKFWYGKIKEGDEVLYETKQPERRPGCALRMVLNAWQVYQGPPSTTTFTMNIDEW